MSLNRVDLGSRRAVQLFLAAWVLFSAFFATNVEREHYPAFSLVDHHDLRVDEYAGFHSDIFVHTDGHAYIGNNVIAALFAAVPLYLFDAPLDVLERMRQRDLASGEAPVGEYRTYEHHPNRKAFFETVTQRGLDLRFGGATAITTALFMAPLSALMVVLFFQMLLTRGVTRGRATAYALLFGFATPIFFRTSALSHNMVTMYATFGSFWLMWPREPGAPAPLDRRVWAGVLAGIALASDYSGVIPLLALYGYLVGVRWREVGFVRSVTESIPFVLGSVPPVLFLLFSQWAMFGNPFLPGQYWMPEVNYTDQGWRGFAWPAPDLFWLNLFSLEWGMFPFAPLLLLGFVPAWWYARDRLVLPRAERWFVFGFVLAYLIFCAANQYSRMQWNTGFRYLLPLVPFVFLAAVDHLERMPRQVVAVLAGLALIHSWVIASVREAALQSWQLLLQDGVQLPWLTVLRMTRPEGAPVISSAWLPIVLLVTVCGGVWWMWRRLEHIASRSPAR
ncbi:MAG: hypothetical protein KC645_05620 [Gemmatimonadetes bacterium]|nr:hypothetical protein [Gemmatimonadota bacterium]